MFAFLRRKSKKEKAEEEVRRWMQSQGKKPLQELWHELMAGQEGASLEVIQAQRTVAREIEDILVERNLKGKGLEKQGKLDEAIAFYEANLSDKFDGSHPYERLRIIYAKRKDYDLAIRVCEAALELPKATEGWRKKYQGWVEKYKKKG